MVTLTGRGDNPSYIDLVLCRCKYVAVLITWIVWVGADTGHLELPQVVNMVMRRESSEIAPNLNVDSTSINVYNRLACGLIVL